MKELSKEQLEVRIEELRDRYDEISTSYTREGLDFYGGTIHKELGKVLEVIRSEYAKLKLKLEES